jgi:hypothetical protein
MESCALAGFGSVARTLALALMLGRIEVTAARGAALDASFGVRSRLPDDVGDLQTLFDAQTDKFETNTNIRSVAHDRHRRD